MNSIVKIAPSFVKKETGPEVSRDLPPHSGTHRTGSVGGHWRWGSGSTGPARQMTRQPRHESGRAGANGPRGCPSLLERLVGRGRAPPPDLHADAGAHLARVFWWIPTPNQKRGDHALPPLRCERGFGAAHVEVLSDVSAAAPRPHRGNRMGPLASGEPRGTVGEREREEGRDLLLWASYASEGGSGEGEGAELPPREDRPAGALQYLGAEGDFHRQSPETPAKCIHCQGEHPANHKGCSAYKTLHNNKYPKLGPKEITKQESRPKKFSTPSISYVQAVQGNISNTKTHSGHSQNSVPTS